MAPIEQNFQKMLVCFVSELYLEIGEGDCHQSQLSLHRGGMILDRKEEEAKIFCESMVLEVTLNLSLGL